MGEISVNTFNKGMNQDVGKTVPQEGSYLNGRPSLSKGKAK